MVLTKRNVLAKAEWLAIFLLALYPFAHLFYRILINDLGPDPAEEVVKVTGLWGMYFLWITLAISPLKILFRFTKAMRYRRMMGLYTLFYASLHILAFLTFILEWQWDRIFEELVKRPYITIGFLAFCMLVPLGATSFKWMMRKMGRNWARLHRLVYVIAPLVLLHFFWQLRADIGQAVLFCAILLLLFAIRLWKRYPFRQWVSRYIL